jgi:holliday junction DNA helicase RuvA
MISIIKGLVFKNSLSKDSFVEVQTEGGVGYRVFVTKDFDFKEEGEEIFLYTSYQVRDDSQTLYGFSKEEEKMFFEKLISISGIGPKIGMAILSEYSSSKLKTLIKNGDISSLSKVSGLGKKGAQKIVLELSGELKVEEELVTEDEIINDVRNALESLGYKGSVLKESVEKAKEICKEKDLRLEDVLKLVLKG